MHIARVRCVRRRADHNARDVRPQSPGPFKCYLNWKHWDSAYLRQGTFHQCRETDPDPDPYPDPYPDP